MATESQQKFIDSIAGYVAKYAPQYGILVNSTIIAQAINESGWGTSDLAKRHNYFGLKCRSGWTGPSYSKVTQEEYIPGTVVNITDNFRVFDSMEAGVKGYFDFLFEAQAYGRYDNLRGITDPIIYAQTIKDDGYCTRSNYVSELVEIIDSYKLRDFDQPSKGGNTVNIQRKIVAPGHGTFANGQPTYFAVHSTANPGATAANHVSYWSRPASQDGGQDYAVHFVSDWKEAYQCVELTNKCWQVGNGNPYCIGLEICEATNQADFLRGLEIARSVILQTLDRYGWNVDQHVRSHKWFTDTYGGSDHTDPIPYLKKWGWTWEQFMAFLKEGESDMALTDADVERIAARVWERTWGDKMMGSMVYDTNREVMRTDDPTGRDVEMTVHDHIKWMANEQKQLMANIHETNTLLDRLIKAVAAPCDCKE